MNGHDGMSGSNGMNGLDRSFGSNRSKNSNRSRNNDGLSGSFHSSIEDASFKSIDSTHTSRSLMSYISSYSGYDSSKGSKSFAEEDGTDGYTNPVVASKEQKAVFFARLVVVCVLVIALAAVTYTMFSVIKRNERQEFENQFATSASEISSLVQDNCKTAIDSAEAFSTMITSAANANDSEWPYVSIVDYTSKAKRLATLSGAYQIGFAPIVYPNQFVSWPVHSYLNLPSYYGEAVKVLDTDQTVDDIINTTLPFVWHPDTLSGTPQQTDPLEPETPPQLYALRKRIGFDGFFVNWQSLDPLYDLYGGSMAITNLNLLYAGFEDAFTTSYEFKIPAFDSYRNPVVDPVTMKFLEWESQTQMVQPIFDTIYNGDGSREGLNMVGALNMIFDWKSLLRNLISAADIKDIEVVLSARCSRLSRPVTFRINETDVVQKGLEDLHDVQYDGMGLTYPLFELELDEETQAAVDKRRQEQLTATVGGGCVSEIFMDIYPTKELEDSFYTNYAWVLSGGVAAVFVFTSFIFLVYDMMVKRRQTKVMERIIRQDKIVLNTFPKAVRDRLYKDAQARDSNDSERFSYSQGTIDNKNEDSIFGSGQIADLYPSATVVFADIVGFTAWSSAREPTQVFKLLETIYKEFDKLAYRNNIFKVETVGDCYVAVAGVPEKCDDHVLAVAKFSRDCMHKMPVLVGKLEIILGPDTADLQLRIGLNTGQVTAGVLRGDKARFQLFGDTVNTASRMETTSKAGCIHVSASTADALIKAGRQRWLKKRMDTVLVKGKGQMQTYYVETLEESMQRSKLQKYKKSKSKVSTANAMSLTSSVITEESTNSDNDDEEGTTGNIDILDESMHLNMSKTDRLVEWNVEILSYLLKQILVARPEHLKYGNKSVLATFEGNLKGGEECAPTTVLDEFQEIIELPSIGAEELLQRKHPSTIQLRPIVVQQLRELLKNIAAMYNENPFHNFEHASHVTASVRKLLTRIVDADHHRNSFDGNESQRNNHELHDLSGHSYGITSDPLTQFAVVFSAVIHDADHPGVPNVQLVKEKTKMAQHYRKSIAEQNSVELVWELLMSSDYDDLRSCIYSSHEELKRFRQLVVNTVMATDIVDKELQNLRKMRWEKAFSLAEELELEAVSASTPQLNMNRKATIVIEHLIQASDVSHTMQHWNIYRKWNQKFFFELYDAYKNGRAETDPSIGWYKGEIGFFDFYIIPLAKKLESCGVFGVSSLEYLNYAQSNRDEWVREGEQVVKEFLENYHNQRDRTTKSVFLDERT